MHLPLAHTADPVHCVSVWHRCCILFTLFAIFPRHQVCPAYRSLVDDNPAASSQYKYPFLTQTVSVRHVWRFVPRNQALYRTTHGALPHTVHLLPLPHTALIVCTVCCTGTLYLD